MGRWKYWFCCYNEISNLCFNGRRSERFLVLQIAAVGENQIMDSGAKMIHLAPNNFQVVLFQVNC